MSTLLPPKQTESIWIIESGEPQAQDDVRDYFYVSRSAALEAYYNEYSQIGNDVTFRELKRAVDNSPKPPLDITSVKYR